MLRLNRTVVTQLTLLTTNDTNNVGAITFVRVIKPFQTLLLSCG